MQGQHGRERNGLGVCCSHIYISVALCLRQPPGSLLFLVEREREGGGEREGVWCVMQVYIVK